MLGAGLMCQNMGRRSARIRRKDWPWDEYDEIWGFDMIPEDYPDYHLHAEALKDRYETGIPTPLDEQDYADFYARVERRRESRIQRGETV
eukprot:1113006-Heterocapsa_arctica.AAC.1